MAGVHQQPEQSNYLAEGQTCKLSISFLNGTANLPFHLRHYGSSLAGKDQQQPVDLTTRPAVNPNYQVVTTKPSRLTYKVIFVLILYKGKPCLIEIDFVLGLHSRFQALTGLSLSALVWQVQPSCDNLILPYACSTFFVKS